MDRGSNNAIVMHESLGTQDCKYVALHNAFVTALVHKENIIVLVFRRECFSGGR